MINRHTLRVFARPAVFLALVVTFDYSAGMAHGQAALTDEEIVAIALNLNQGEVLTNQPATTKASNAQVRQFAERMVTDHAAAVQQIRALNVQPVESNVSRQLMESARETFAILEQWEGAAYDAEHMRSQVEMHEHALSTLNEYLIPSARSGRLRSILEQNRDTVQEHLVLARRVRAAVTN